ncbi:hypothetical protein ACJIZ3_000008 [Penstemon smallii]|uniref:Transposase n=1 Tax=Penstemon smallii TaxID=265156 RepID=A0ABD3RDT6_9LAMI
MNIDLLNESHRQRGSNEHISSNKPKIDIPEGLDKPVGQHSSKHASQIGILIKLEAPMQVEGWANIPEDTLNYEHDKKHVMKCIERSFAKQYSTFRSNVHKHYKKWRDEVGVELAKEHIYEKLDNRSEDWLWLCDFFETEKFKKISETQSKNRSKLKTQHKLGTKSRAAHQYEKTLDDIDMYKTEYYNSKNGWAGEVLGETSSYVKSKVVKRRKLVGEHNAVSESFEYQKRLEEELSTTKATMKTLVQCLEKMSGKSMSEILNLEEW